MKFKFLLPVVLMFSLVLSACSSSTNSSTSGEKNGVVTLNWFFWADSKDAAAWKKLADGVQKKYPNIHVNLQTAPWAEYWSKLQAEAASGTTPDIISMQSLQINGYGTTLLPLDDYIKNDPSLNINDFNKPILNNLSYDGHQVALPYDFGSQIVFYNEDLFKKNNVPLPKPGWTMADFENAAKALSHGGTYGFINSSAPDNWLPFVLSNGGSYLNNGKYDFNNSVLVNTVQTLADLAKNNISPKLGAQTAAPDQFVKGNIGMVVDGPWDVMYYRNSAKFKFGMVPIPVGSKDSVSISAGSGFGISKSSKHPKEAFEAISYITSVESLKQLGAAGRAYPARDTSRPAYFTQVPADFKTTLDYADQHTVPYVITKTWSQASDMIGKAMVPILNGEKSAKDGLNDLQKQLEGIQQ